mgnify:CR=1 FL=1
MEIRGARPFPFGRVTIDYETPGLSPYAAVRPFICGLEDEGGNVILTRPGDGNWWKVPKIIQDPNIEKVAHGSKFELKHSYHMGYIPRGKWHDTMGKAVFVDEYQKINLGALSSRYLKDDTKDIVKKWLEENGRRIRRETGRDPNYTDVPPELLETYLEGDLDKTLRLDNLWRHVETDFKQLYEMEIDLSHDLARMEDHGLHLDLAYVEKQIIALRPEMLRLEQELWAMAGVRFNPDSPRELSYILETMGLDTGMRNKDGTLKTKFDLLVLMDPNPFINKLIRWRGLKKIVGTYFIPFLQNAYGDVLHGTLWQYGKDDAIVTGRLSSSDPNLQNFPGGGRGAVRNPVLKELGPLVRRAVVPPPGYSLLSFDYKQIEMVIFSCLAGDKRIINDIRNGLDVYVAHGKIIFGKNAFDNLPEKVYKAKRFECKELCLSLIYGMGLKRFANRIGKSLGEAKKIRNDYFRNSPLARDCMIRTTRDLLVKGYVQDTYGRRYHVPKEMAYKATNALCQGPAATVAKRGVIKARQLEHFGFKPIMMIHDELMGIVPIENLKACAEAGKELLEEKGTFPVTIKVDAKASNVCWGDQREIE